MNETLSRISKLVEAKVDAELPLGSCGVFQPTGVVSMHAGMIFFLPPPPDAENRDNPVRVLHALSEVNKFAVTAVSGMVCEVFMKKVSVKEFDDYEHGDLSGDTSADSALILMLQERESKERYFSMKSLDGGKWDVLTERGGEFGGTVMDVELY